MGFIVDDCGNALEAVADGFFDLSAWDALLVLVPYMLLVSAISPAMFRM